MSNSIKAPLYSVAALFSAVGLGLSIPLIVFSFPAKAQTNQSFSQCVLKLYRNPYSSTDAAKNCLAAFKGRSVNEEFSTCVSALYRNPFSSTDANRYCQQAFENSASPTPANNGNPTIIVVPQSQQQPNQRQYTERRVCISPVGTQVYSTKACELGVSGFTWKTIYE
jgi:hypothetical protein